MKQFIRSKRDGKVIPYLAALAILPLLIPMLSCRAVDAQQSRPALLAAPALFSTKLVVYNLDQMNLHRAKALKAFQGTRVYRVQYKGLIGDRKAKLVVKVEYLPPGRKKFIIQSSSGSKMIIDKVLKRLLETEKNGTSAKRKRRSALTSANYHFKLLGHAIEPSGPAYVLEVAPRRKDKFLYHGRIWVDAGDFAVVRLQGELAKSPSFWIKKSKIVEVYRKVGDFWLPSSNLSVSNIRFGGHAELTIEYKDYKITGASQVKALLTNSDTPAAETADAQ